MIPATGGLWRRVIVESPFAGDVETNLAYLRACMADCFSRGEAPFASHGLYTQPGVLDDGDAAERGIGIEAGLRWGEAADATVVYSDLGVSGGMERGIAAAAEAGRRVEWRTLPGWRPGVLPKLDGRTANSGSPIYAGLWKTPWRRYRLRPGSALDRRRPMKIRPLMDRILVKRVAVEEMTPGGIVIPEQAKEKPVEGEVVAVGDGKEVSEGKLRPLLVKPGDRVLFSRYGGTEIKVEGVEHVILREEDILGVYETRQ